jgi:branched-chain amino acid transport system substrate-binding protein
MLFVLIAVSWLFKGLFSEPDEIVIGFLGSISGKYGTLGSTARDGALLAVEEINASGGIKEHRVELVILDDEGEPQKAAAHAEKLADDGIQFIIGPFLTSSGTSVLPIINKRKILTISGTTMGQNLADLDDYYLVLIPTTTHYGKSLAKVALEVGHLRFASVSDSKNDPYCSTFMDGVRSEIKERPFTSLEEIEFQTSAVISHWEIVKPLDLDQVDAVFLCASSLDTAMIAQNLKMKNSKVALLSTSWGISRELIQNGGSAVEGLYFFQPINSSDTSENYIRFRDSFRNRFNTEPSYVAIFNYEAVNILASCLKMNPGISTDKAKISILNKEKLTGVQGDFRLDTEGDAIRPLILHKIHGRAFLPVTNP